MKLYLKPNICKFEFLFDAIPYASANTPFYLNLFNPISNSSNVVFTLSDSFNARAPSTSDIFANILSTFNDLLVFNIWAIAFVPDTPILFELISRIYNGTLLSYDNAFANAFAPYFLKLFLDKFKIFKNE